MRKRGMSDVVTTLIIILLVIVALGIVWVVVKNILDKGKDEITLTGLTLDLEISKAVLDDKGTPETDDDELFITVKRNPGEGNLVGINFVISDGDNSVVVTEDTNLAELGVKTFSYFTRTFAVGPGPITSISIAPIFETSAGKEIIGEILDTTTGDFGTGDPDYTGPSGGGGDSPSGGCDPACGIGYTCVGETCVLDGCIPEGDSVTCAAPIECGTVLDNCEIPVDCDAFYGGDCVVQHGVGWVCGQDDYICYDESCTPLTPEVACAGNKCGWVNDGCGTNIDCDLINGGCIVGEECIENVCTLITYVNSGVVEWFGPPGVTQYFSSITLPDPAITNYDSHFVTFPNLAIPDCYFILNYNYDYDVYQYVIVELLLSEPINIIEGESYQIWESNNDCCNSLTNPGPNCTP